MDKYRKNSQEWIDLLKEKNLLIPDEEKFKWYIDNYNFFNFVKRYSMPFYSNQDTKKSFYNKNSTSEMIIDLFNLNRNLSCLILADILSIEKKLSTLICKEIIDSNSEKIPNLKNIHFYDLKDDDFYSIFPKIKYAVPNREDKIEYLKERLFKNGKNKNKEKYIWECFLKFDFGQICEIFSYIDTPSKRNIASLFTGFKKNTKFYFEFQKMIELINYFRNMICHNNPIYNINYNQYKKNKELIICLYKEIFFKEISEIKLFNIINMIVLICPQKTKLYDMTKSRFDVLFSKYNEDFTKNIKKIVNYE